MRIPALIVAVCLSGCGGGVVLQFHNDKDGALEQGLNDRPTSVFGMKLVAVYLATDVDPATQNNLGATEMIYLNPVCADDIGHCELGPGTQRDDGQPYTQFVTDYFDFNAGSAAVNAAIGAQQRSIAPGSYKFTRMEFCKDNAQHLPNVQWAYEGAATRELSVGGCGVTSAPIAEPIVVGAGQTVAVTLSYDLSTAISDKGIDCVAGNCLTMPTFVPSATVQ